MSMDQMDVFLRDCALRDLDRSPIGTGPAVYDRDDLLTIGPIVIHSIGQEGISFTMAGGTEGYINLGA